MSRHTMPKASVKAPTPAPTPAPADADLPRHRSGAVARMVRMPVATLRVWERRYAVARPALSPSGQRLYSAADVQRLALLKRLTDMGHAIGGLALLTMKELQAVAATHASALPGPSSPQPPQPPISAVLPASSVPLATPARRICHVVMVGLALATRLQQPALMRAWHPAVRLSGPFVDVAQAAAAVGRAKVDLLLVHEARPDDGWLADCNGAAPAFAATPKALLYRFATEGVVTALVLGGVQVLREPQTDAVVGQWLRGLTPPAAGAVIEAAAASMPMPMPAPPRRWGDAVLSDIAALSSTVACECPRHVAELLMQLSHFEAYSADCMQRSPADALLHQHLQQVAAASRALFESALERVAQHEGLLLPG